MSFEAALRATEILLALALVQQSIEHLALHRDERLLFLPRLCWRYCCLKVQGPRGC
jgi:hypothetical protein